MANHDTPALTPVLERNIETLKRHETAQEARRTPAERTAGAITDFAGSIPFVFLQIVLFGAWIFVNLGWISFVRPFDPSFMGLTVFASLEAIFLAAFILIKQNRMAKLAELRASLDLQISLLTEHELTRLIAVVDAIASKGRIDAGHAEELAELKKDVAPEAVLEALQEREE